MRRLIDEFELTHEAIAQAIGRSRSTITNSLRLLKLPEPIQDMMAQHHLEMGHARAIINLPVQQQLELAHKAVKHAWSVREMERRSQEILKDKPAAAQPHPDIQHIAEQLTEKLGVLVEIKTRNQKSGQIILKFNSPEQFEQLLEHL